MTFVKNNQDLYGDRVRPLVTIFVPYGELIGSVVGPCKQWQMPSS